MAKLLEELYFGDIKPCERLLEKGSELSTAMEGLSCLEEKLLAQLDPEGRKTFLAYCGKQSQVNSLTAFDNFQCGFRLGARLLLEIMEEKNDSEG